jgi:hypothetical protein
MSAQPTRATAAYTVREATSATRPEWDGWLESPPAGATSTRATPGASSSDA